MTDKADKMLDTLLATAITDLERQAEEAQQAVRECHRQQREDTAKVIQEWRAFYRGVQELMASQFAGLKGRIEEAHSQHLASGGRVGGEPSPADTAEKNRKLDGVFRDGRDLIGRWNKAINNL
jgi:hypothetical protein